MNDNPATPSPTADTTPRPDRDHRPGLRTLLVPRLLSQGLTPAQAARSTYVPVPLVTLIAEHEPGTPALSLTQATPWKIRPTSMSVPARGRKSAARARMLFVAAVMAGCIGSILWHEPLLPIVLVVAGSLAGNSLRDHLPAGRRHAPRP